MDDPPNHQLQARAELVLKLVSLDGPVELSGSANTSAGDAVGGGRDADAAGGGDLFLLADDANGLPDTGANDDAIDLLDDLGGDILVGGSLTATGGNGGGAGDTDGSDGGMITVDADGDDGEEPTNGTVELADGVAMNATGGNTAPPPVVSGCGCRADRRYRGVGVSLASRR